MNMEEKEKGNYDSLKNVPAWPAMPEDDREIIREAGWRNSSLRAFKRAIRGVSSARVSREGPKKSLALVVVDEDDDG